jgi:hypothetical protein
MSLFRPHSAMIPYCSAFILNTKDEAPAKRHDQIVNVAIIVREERRLHCFPQRSARCRPVLEGVTPHAPPQAGVYVENFVNRHSDLKQLFVLFMIRSNKADIGKASKQTQTNVHRVPSAEDGGWKIFSDRRPQLYTNTA